MSHPNMFVPSAKRLRTLSIHPRPSSDEPYLVARRMKYQYKKAIEYSKHPSLQIHFPVSWEEFQTREKHQGKTIPVMKALYTKKINKLRTI